MLIVLTHHVSSATQFQVPSSKFRVQTGSPTRKRGLTSNSLEVLSSLTRRATKRLRRCASDCFRAQLQNLRFRLVVWLGSEYANYWKKPSQKEKIAL